ncbi:MAG: Gldg family protein [Planctomycetales bacterium]|nr:Gldg family protein [Planctomycetales bacterium]
MRSHVVLAVFKRNFWSYFSGMIGYLFIVAFVFVGAFAAFQEKFFTNNLATLDQLNEWFPQLLLFIVPAITMGVWSEERKLGTEELLFTLPVSDLEVLLGKYFAVVAVYTVALLFSLTHAVVLAWIGEPDAGLLFANYFGYWLAGCALLSAGMVASYLTNSATVAFVLASLICVLPIVVGLVPIPAPLQMLVGNDQFFEQMSLPRQFAPFGIGLIEVKSVLYFLSFTGFMLYVNLVLIGQRHWKGGVRGASMGWQYAARGVCLALILVSGNALLSGSSKTVDMTGEQVFTVAPTTNKLLGNLNAKRPVTIQAFVSKEVPRDYAPVKTLLLGLLSQYEQASHGNITVRVAVVDPASPQAEEAKKFGIEGRKVQSERAGRTQVDEVYLGAVINSGANEVVIPFFDVGLPLEYELTRTVNTVAAEKRRKVGILETDAKLTGGFDMQSFRSSPEWRIVTELKKQYEVEAVSPAGPIDETKYDVVVAVLPSSLGQIEMQNFVDYVKKGKAVLIFDDPLPATNPQLSPSQPKPRAGGGNPMMQMGQPPEQKADGGKATSLVNALGIQWNYDQVVFDYTAMQVHPEYSELLRPEIVAITPKSGLAKAFNPDSEVTSGLQEMFLFFSGTIKPREGSKLEFTPLLRTGVHSGLLEWKDLVKNSFMGIQIDDDPLRIEDEFAHVIAAQIESPKNATGDRINVIYVADADIISDWFFFVRERKQFHLNLDNVTFVLNAVDSLADDKAYIALRKRRPKHRTLARVEEQTARFIEHATKERQKAAEEAKTALEDAKKQFAEKVEKIKNDPALDDSTRTQMLLIAQAETTRKLEVAEAAINQKKEQSIEKGKIESDRNVRAVERGYYAAALLFPPIPAIVLGLLVWVLRLKDEYKDIAPSRRAPVAK